MKRIYASFTSGLLFTLLCGYGQDFSNKGKDFWLAYPAHIDGNTSRMALYISSNVSTAGIVFVNGSSIPFTVTANQATVVQIFPTTYPVINSQNEGIKAGAGIHIIANAPVVVYAHILNAARSGSSLILPTNTLGREYIATSFRSSTNSGAGNPTGSPSGSQFTIVGVENSTTVEIIPSATDVGGVRPAGTPFTVTLNQGDVYQFRTTFDRDVTGTQIRSLATASSSCKPIAVFSGSSWTTMNCANASGGDNLFQQLMPVNSWGKNYITAPFADREYDIFRIIVKDPTTIVTVDGTALSTASLISNTYYQFSSSRPGTITSDKPVMVVQYMISQTCDSRNSGGTGTVPYPGDPEMIILNPIEQTINEVTVVSARNNLTPPNTNITKHFFTIITKTSALGSLRIDGAPPVGTPNVIGTTGYSYIHENVTVSTNINPSHRIQADSGFIALAYGMGNVESYGYNAGTNVKDLYQFVSIQNQLATVNFPSTCKNTPFLFSMTFPYQPTQIRWVFGTALNAMGIADVTVNSPTYDSTWTVNGRQLYRYRLPGLYNITATGTFPIKVFALNPTPDGCSGEQEIDYDVQVFDRPSAAFGFTTSGCVSDSVRFADSSNTFGRSPIKWYWDFGDGQSSQVRNPAHLYSNAQTYNVRFAVITDIGCISDTVSKQVALSTPPIAKFGVALPYCAGKTLTFTDSSTSVGVAIVKWRWNFGDGSPVIEATTNTPQTHTYPNAGNYTVTLEVESAGGCKSVPPFTKTITISPNPVPNFTFGRGCLPSAAIQFTDASTISGGTQNAFTYSWNFGDGGTDVVRNPVHTYTAAGPYQVKLIVTSSSGCVDSTTKTVDSIFVQPVANFDVPTEVCLGATVNFTDQSTAQNSTITGWAWNFGNGATATSAGPSHTYAAAGMYNVTLTVTSALGCVSSPAAKRVVVNPLPVADFTPSTPTCVTRTVTFTDNSVANAGAITEWRWNFADGSALVMATTGTAQTHTYASTGTFNATLQVRTNKGCVSTLKTIPIVISPLPRANFSMPGNCVNDPISQFFDSSSISDGSGSQFTYQWNFGDANATGANPNTSTAKDPTHRFTVAGDYTIRQIVISNNGCADTATKIFTLNGAVPVSSFTVNSGSGTCSSDSIRITDNSSVSPGRLVKTEIYWDYSGDPTNKTVINNPVIGSTYRHKYPEFFTPATKTYDIQVVSYSGINCLASSQRTVTLLATPNISFPSVTSVCADAQTFLLQANAINMTGGTGVFSGAGVTASGQFTPRTAGVGTHTIRFTYTGANGCVNFKEQTVTVNAVPTVSAGPDRFVLEGGNATLVSTSTGSGLTFLWTPGTYLNNPAIARPITTPTDDIQYTLLVTTANGCSASDEVFVKVLKTPTIPNVFTPNGDGINDRWVIEYLESYPGATVEIFNRYGSLVYRSVGYPTPWDGTYGGKQMPAGTYYYIINPKNGRKQISGFVDIVR